MILSSDILASRIAETAGVGEILVPETVRGLLSGKGFVLSDRSDFVPKERPRTMRHERSRAPCSIAQVAKVWRNRCAWTLASPVVREALLPAAREATHLGMMSPCLSNRSNRMSLTTSAGAD